MESGRREAAGRLRVSAPVLFGRRCVAPVLAKVAAQHPKLELELSLSDRPVDLIEDGFDLAIRGATSVEPHAQGQMRRLRPERICDVFNTRDVPEQWNECSCDSACNFDRR